MLILEGSDCLGKTTFAKLLLKVADKRKEFPTYYNHMSRPNEKFDFFKHYKDMMSNYAIQDRFHLGGIVWHDAICQARLDIIEGWLKSIGSMTIVLYASDHVWYQHRIENDNRGNILSTSSMCSANIEYGLFIEKKHNMKSLVDFAWDITPTKLATPNYPDELFANVIIDKWFKRLKLLERS